MPFANQNILYEIIGILVIGNLILMYFYYNKVRNNNQNNDPSTCPSPSNCLKCKVDN